MGEYDKLLLDKNDASYKRRLAVKIIILLVFLAIIGFGIYKLYPFAHLLGTSEGRQELKDVVDRNRMKGASLFVSLQALQIMLGVIPPLQILGGVMFGTAWGIVLSILGLFLGSVVVFVLVKLIGYPLVQALFSEKKIKRFSFLDNDKKVVTMLALMFLIPGFPKDILTYVVPLTKVSKRDFFLVILPSRIPAIILSGVVGGCIRNGSYVMAVVVSVFVIVASAIGIINRNRIIDSFHRRKQAKNSN